MIFHGPNSCGEVPGVPETFQFKLLHLTWRRVTEVMTSNSELATKLSKPYSPKAPPRDSTGKPLWSALYT